MLEPHTALFQLHLHLLLRIPTLLRCFSDEMARNDESKSLGEARTSCRQLAARMKPGHAGAAAPEPRDLTGGGPAAVGQALGQKVDEGEKVTTPPFILVTFPVRDDSAPISKQGRPRRCYEAEERRQVANTRKRGACDGCRASKTKVS